MDSPLTQTIRMARKLRSLPWPASKSVWIFFDVFSARSNCNPRLRPTCDAASVSTCPTGRFHRCSAPDAGHTGFGRSTRIGNVEFHRRGFAFGLPRTRVARFRRIGPGQCGAPNGSGFPANCGVSKRICSPSARNAPASFATNNGQVIEPQARPAWLGRK